MTKRYLGDGIYADWQEGAFGEVLILTTENGRNVTNEIEIDQERWREIADFVAERDDEDEN